MGSIRAATYSCDAVFAAALTAADDHDNMDASAGLVPDGHALINMIVVPYFDTLRAYVGRTTRPHKRCKPAAAVAKGSLKGFPPYAHPDGDKLSLAVMSAAAATLLATGDHKGSAYVIPGSPESSLIAAAQTPHSPPANAGAPCRAASAAQWRKRWLRPRQARSVALQQKAVGLAACASTSSAPRHQPRGHHVPRA